MTQQPTDPTRRRWRLEAYEGKDRVHSSLCIGDHALNEAMKKVERRWPKARIKASSA